jgi:hypothetical protein
MANWWIQGVGSVLAYPSARIADGSPQMGSFVNSLRVAYATWATGEGIPTLMNYRVLKTELQDQLIAIDIRPQLAGLDQLTVAQAESLVTYLEANVAEMAYAKVGGFVNPDMGLDIENALLADDLVDEVITIKHLAGSLALPCTIAGEEVEFAVTDLPKNKQAGFRFSDRLGSISSYYGTMGAVGAENIASNTSYKFKFSNNFATYPVDLEFSIAIPDYGEYSFVMLGTGAKLVFRNFVTGNETVICAALPDGKEYAVWTSSRGERNVQEGGYKITGFDMRMYVMDVGESDQLDYVGTSVSTRTNYPPRYTNQSLGDKVKWVNRSASTVSGSMKLQELRNIATAEVSSFWKTPSLTAGESVFDIHGDFVG